MFLLVCPLSLLSREEMKMVFLLPLNMAFLLLFTLLLGPDVPYFVVDGQLKLCEM